MLQAYLRDSPEQLAQVIELGARSRRTPPLQVRLVKGAYWDHELVQARQHGWPAPVFEDKADCDRNFEALTRALLAARPALRVASPRTTCARSPTRSRSTGSPAATTVTSSSRSCAASATSSRHALAARGFRVRTYCPVGDLVAGMAYLVRRLLENTSERIVPQRAGARASPLDQRFRVRAAP